MDECELLTMSMPMPIYDIRERKTTPTTSTLWYNKLSNGAKNMNTWEPLYRIHLSRFS